MKKIAVYLALINLLTFAAYGIDKRKAQKNAWRIKESTLLLLAAAVIYLEVTDGAASGGGRRLGRRVAWYADLSAQDEASEVYRRRAADPARADRACGMVGFALKNCEKIYIILIL